MENIMVTRSSMPPLDEFVKEISSLWDTHWLTNMGQLHQRLEDNLKNYLKVNELSLFSNGHMALELAIQAMNLTGEVITTPFTFASTTHAIVRNGLKPVFCDINKDDCTIDTTKIESLITEKTSAIVPVHVYGNICDVEKIEEIASRHDLKIIYDAAHAFGEEIDGRGIGTYGDASMFSFHATKVYNTIEGGCVTYKNKAFGLDLYRLKNFGIRDEETVDEVGANAKMNEFQAAMGICNLRYVDDEIEKRKNNVHLYRMLLSDIPGITIILKNSERIRSNYAYFPIYIDKEKFGISRDELYSRLKENGIYSRKYFYPLTNTFECYNSCFNPQLTPIALMISQGILTLPLYADLKEDQIKRICNCIIESRMVK